jgi:transcriptional regulator with XRE-family HTH domain
MYAVPMSEFGDKLKSVRERQELTLQDVATAAGISRAAVSRLESGDRNPSRPMVKRLAVALGWEMQEALRSAGFLPDAGGTLPEGFRREVLGHYEGMPLEGIVPSNVTSEQLGRIRLAVRIALERDEGITLDPDTFESANSGNN